jgi:hypothetical protein
MGPIRSGRLIDLEIPLMYDSAFAYSGSSIGVAYKLGESEFNNRILRSGARGYYRTGDDSIPFEHTFYGEPELWYEVLEERELKRSAAVPTPTWPLARRPRRAASQPATSTLPIAR